MNELTNDQNYIYGKNPIREKLKIIKNGTLFIKKNLSTIGIDDIIQKAKDKNLTISIIDPVQFDQFFGSKNHQGIALKVDLLYAQSLSEQDFLTQIKAQTVSKSTILILDGIKDVGNLGAILRTALLFDVDAVILPKNNSAPVTDAVVKRSSGAVFFSQIIYVTNLVRIIEELKKLGYWIYGAEKQGEKIQTVRFDQKCTLVLGEENKGIRPLVKKSCDQIINIPTNGKLDSLNVSVSAGIILYEIQRQRTD